ncbi:Uma2 family endonuclease [Lewinella sp. 4G2]|uniref:Uma2 family endonuclease n=1 Tax=Lewinella sp. 4G2 TaxID=1803372 RepID=UPI0007B48994|nr:Uma2 family endonuclease [Lewinella sp. 4G2]OAV44240.1 hypothetical protein A3850_006910 [Lewinella sp. 4G2]
MGQPKLAKVPFEDYLTIERRDDMRYAYIDGEIFSMAGGTIQHTRICSNAHGVLRDVTRKTGTCEPFTSEMKIEVKARGKYFYPDAGLACPEYVESKHLTGAIVNPKLIVEVTSKESAGYDNSEKFRAYWSIPSVHEYILIEQEQPRVTIYRRRNDLMKMDHYEGLDAVVPLESVEGELRLADIYEKVRFEEEA